MQGVGKLASGLAEASVRLAEGVAGAAGSLVPALGTLPALLLAMLALGIPSLGAYYALRSLLQTVRARRPSV